MSVKVNEVLLIKSVTVPLPVILIYGRDGKNSALYRQHAAVKTMASCPSKVYVKGLQLKVSEIVTVSRKSCSMFTSSLYEASRKYLLS